MNKEDILQAPHFQTLLCPEFGEIHILPYLSHGALAAYFDARMNPKRAFFAMLEKSIQRPEEVTSQLSDNDCHVIAVLYASETNCLHQYETAKSANSVFDAFCRAVSSTALWTNFNSMQSNIKSQIQSLYIPQLNWVSDLLGTVYRQLDFEKQLLRNCVFQDAIISQSIVQRAFSDGIAKALSSKTNALLGIETVVQQHLAAWDQFRPLHEHIEKSLKAFTRQTEWLTALKSQMTHIRGVVTPTFDFSTTLQKLVVEFQKHAITDDALFLANDSILQVKTLVSQVSRYFSRQSTLSPRFQKPRFDVASPEEETLVNEVEDSAEEAEILLHEGTSDALRMSQLPVLILSEHLDDILKERLQPYKHILERLSFLSQPHSFFDLLTRFGKQFSREYWKTLWEKPGEQYRSKPESIAQMALGTYLAGVFHNVAFVGREIGCGAGYVDLLVNLLAKDYLVELKIIGCGWGIGDAKSGLHQLDSYMGHYSQQEAFLVVFDGRKTDTGERLRSEYQVDNGIIKVLAIPVYCKPPTL